ncbi:MAG: cephalosporin hydroxylase family protein [Planctomycetota bacterium]
MSADPVEAFEAEVRGNIASLGADGALHRKSMEWLQAITPHRYPYNFRWLGRPIIQLPQDVVAVQELVWETRPDVIVETGIAHGGSLVLSASILAMLDLADAAAHGGTVDPRRPARRVIGVDIDIRAHNRVAVEAHPLAPWIRMVQGSSIDPSTVAAVRSLVPDGARVLVMLDSNHTHDHVLAELRAYAPLTSPGSWCIVFDTLLEDMPAEFCAGRPWAPGNSPKTAVHAYVREDARFRIDASVHEKLQLTVAPDGYLRRIS